MSGRSAPGERPGGSGEERACQYLRSRGYEIVARNFRVRQGEIDIVARCAGTTVFVEVKEREASSHGGALEAVTRSKMRRVIQAAKVFAQLHDLTETALRFDVIAIEIDPAGAPCLRHEQGAFDARGR